MKHVIVIETVDNRFPLRCGSFEQGIIDAARNAVMEHLGECFVQARFYQRSAIAAVHEMYGATPWNPEKDH